MISTTLEERMVSRNTTTKNSTLKSHAGKRGKRGKTAISKVVAQVLGTQSRGPTQSITNTLISLDGTLPRFERMEPSWSWRRTISSMVKIARPTSAVTKHKKPVNHPLPDARPRKGGKIRFPAPKKTANIANPMTKISEIRNCLRFISVASCYYYQTHYTQCYNFWQIAQFGGREIFCSGSLLGVDFCCHL